MGAPSNTRAIVTIADYIAVDAAGKMNALGQGFTVTGLQPTGVTAPHYVAALIDLPATAAGDQVPVTLELRDESSGSLVKIPDGSGGLTALRVQQLVPVQRVQLPGVFIPNDVPCRVQVILGFPGGLALTPGHKFAWKLEVDGTRFKAWAAHFYIAGPAPLPVIGGPSGAASIPNVESPVIEQDDEPG